MTIGDHIGQYRIVEQIGVGGMGSVYLGEHMLLRRRAAIKTLLPKHMAHPELVERFFNEARAASAISDPGVVQIFDFGYHVDGSAYIVMELLEGETLSERIDRLGKLSVGETLRIARQAAGSLFAAHTHAIVHRDLKPENIYLVPDSEAQGGERTKILDFGICKVRNDTDPSLTDAGTTIGTPAYMSPEQCRGLDTVDHRADIYAFGCLMFHMLTGHTPFEAGAPGDYLIAHIRDVPPPPSALADVPPEVDALVLRCLAKSPDARFATMAELQAAIGEVAARLGMSASGTPPSTRALTPAAITPPIASSQPVDEPIVQPRRWPVIGAIVLAGLLTVAGAIYVTMDVPADDDAGADVAAFVTAASEAGPAQEPAPPPKVAPEPTPPAATTTVAPEPAPSTPETPAPAAAARPKPRSKPALHRHAATQSPQPPATSTEDLYDTR
ncbi:MAG TPA: protein kinase [Kofleriaceae bacterium]